MWSRNISFTDGELHLSGISASKLAKDFGTPAFFIDEADFRARATAWNNALRDEFGSHAGTVYYAAKAFISVAVAQWIRETGIGIDVCTGGELAVALAGGIDPKKIEVHGNNKSLAEMNKSSFTLIVRSSSVRVSVNPTRARVIASSKPTLSITCSIACRRITS